MVPPSRPSRVYSCEVAESTERGCIGCGATLVAMGAFAMIYPWPEKVEGTQGMVLLGIRMAFLCAGILGIVALGIGIYMTLLKKTNPPPGPSDEQEEK